MLKVGITGGIGSGKSTVCRLFELMGIPVFYADASGKYLLESEEAVKSEVKALFGPQAYTAAGKPDRKWIADVVFKDNAKLESLNQIIHPAVKRAFEDWSSAQQAPYVLKEAALMFESGSFRQNSVNVLVFSPLDLRIKRVMQRDGSTKEAVLARIAKQMPEDEKQKLSDFIIFNQEDQMLIPQVIKLHEYFLSICQQN